MYKKNLPQRNYMRPSVPELPVFIDWNTGSSGMLGLSHIISLPNVENPSCGVAAQPSRSHQPSDVSQNIIIIERHIVNVKLRVFQWLYNITILSKPKELITGYLFLYELSIILYRGYFVTIRRGIREHRTNGCACFENWWCESIVLWDGSGVPELPVFRSQWAEEAFLWLFYIFAEMPLYYDEKRKLLTTLIGFFTLLWMFDIFAYLWFFYDKRKILFTKSGMLGSIWY